MNFSQKHILSNKNKGKHPNNWKLNTGWGGGGTEGQRMQNTLLVVPKTNYLMNNYEKEV